MYQPWRVFLMLDIEMIAIGCVSGIRFLYFFIIEQSAGHVQSLILSAILLMVYFQIVLIGLLADLISFNRKILEEILYRLRKLDATTDQ
jgi:hypothetical protein